MSAQNEAVVRRFFEEMCNDRKNELADDLFTAGHVLHDPQIPATGKGPKAMVETVKVYQDGAQGRWQIDDIFSAGDRVAVRWTGSGKHVGEVNGIPPTGKKVNADAISIFRLEKGKIAESWEVWDTLGFLQQIGVVPKQ